MLCHESLENYYKTNFQLMHHHKYSLAELENMFPFEREIYIELLVALIKEQEKEQTRGY
jgi:hypothetical protein|tara:strand:- start:288 stop:464 length:177 start_codon:yes stop_codon:yes gene_type:complete